MILNAHNHYRVTIQPARAYIHASSYILLYECICKCLYIYIMNIQPMDQRVYCVPVALWPWQI